MAETKIMREFREAVLSGITRVETEVTNIVRRLDTLNGSVARHEAAINEIKISDAKHESLVSDVAALKTDVAALKLSNNTTENKIAFAEKYANQLWAVGGASMIWLFQHIPQLQKMLGGQ